MPDPFSVNFSVDARHRLRVYPSARKIAPNRLAGTFPDLRRQKSSRTRRRLPCSHAA